MTGHLRVLMGGPMLSVQDLGRPGYLSNGLSRGGAADRLALVEGAALLGQGAGLAAIEMAGYGGTFEALRDMRIALTGAPMKAKVDDQALVWNAVQIIRAGQRVSIGAANKGLYGYLHVGGGIASKPILGSQSFHMVAGIGGPIETGCVLPVGMDAKTHSVGLRLPVSDRFSGGTVRVTPSAQTFRFSKSERERFEGTQFVRTAHGNRQGVKLAFEGSPFVAEGQLSVLSEVMVPGDIQMTGDGSPFVLLPECQTTGGYPRIGTVLPQDLPIVAQTAPGAQLNFSFVSLEQALETAQRPVQMLADLGRRIQPLIRDPRDIPDLLSYQLIGGMTAGKELSEEGNGGW